MVYLRITSEDPDLMMPPPTSNLQLSEYEVRLIEKWIQQGAQYEEHWAFLPPEKPEAPEVNKQDWPQNDIERFVLAKMDLVGLQPNDAADKERLPRRVSVDRTGFPPNLPRMDKYLADDSPQDNEKKVD